MTATQLLSSSEVARRLGRSRQAIAAAAAAGRIPYETKVAGARGAYLFDADSIDRLAAARADLTVGAYRVAREITEHERAAATK